MKHIILPSQTQERLVYYLAVEEYLAQCDHEGFFVWQCRPTVIFGRNQDMAAEVDLAYCEANGIEVYRRRSGGGCVYADDGNLMLSYITRGDDVQAAFEAYLERLSSFLEACGLDAVATEHNDVLVNGRKVSGNACFAKGRMIIVHGTLLYDEDFERMLRAITPSAQKLASHRVQSVRQRCINLRETGFRMPVDELKDALVRHFCSGGDDLAEMDEHHLLPTDDKIIRQIEETYLDPSFINGRQS